MSKKKEYPLESGGVVGAASPDDDPAAVGRKIKQGDFTALESFFRQVALTSQDGLKVDNPVPIVGHDLALTYSDAVKINRYNTEEAQRQGVDAAIAVYMYELLDARFAVYVLEKHRVGEVLYRTPRCFVVHPSDVYQLYVERKVWNAHFPVETVSDSELYYRQVRMLRSNDVPIGSPMLF